MFRVVATVLAFFSALSLAKGILLFDTTKNKAYLICHDLNVGVSWKLCPSSLDENEINCNETKCVTQVGPIPLADFMKDLKQFDTGPYSKDTDGEKGLRLALKLAKTEAQRKKLQTQLDSLEAYFEFEKKLSSEKAALTYLENDSEFETFKALFDSYKAEKDAQLAKEESEKRQAENDRIAQKQRDDEKRKRIDEELRAEKRLREERQNRVEACYDACEKEKKACHRRCDYQGGNYVKCYDACGDAEVKCRKPCHDIR